MVHYRGGRAAIDPDGLSRHRGVLARPRTQVYADQIEALGELGCTYLQLDDTSLAYLNDPAQREYINRIGGDGEHQHVTYIRHLNAALARKPAAMRVCTHMCRGNFKSSWVATGQLRARRRRAVQPAERRRLLPRVRRCAVGRVRAAALRAGGQVRRARPGHDEEGRARAEGRPQAPLDEASKFVPLEQLCLSPQCGFSSTVEGNALTIDEEIAKLALIVRDGARGVGLSKRKAAGRGRSSAVEPYSGRGHAWPPATARGRRRRRPSRRPSARRTRAAAGAERPRRRRTS